MGNGVGADVTGAVVGSGVGFGDGGDVVGSEVGWSVFDQQLLWQHEPQ